jgi:hypothetical protein
MATRRGEKPEETAATRTRPDDETTSEYARRELREDVLIVADDGELYHIRPQDFAEALRERRVSRMSREERQQYEPVHELLGRGVTMGYLPTRVPESMSKMFPDVGPGVRLIGIFCFLVNLYGLKQERYYDRPKRIE